MHPQTGFQSWKIEIEISPAFTAQHFGELVVYRLIQKGRKHGAHFDFILSSSIGQQLRDLASFTERWNFGGQAQKKHVYLTCTVCIAHLNIKGKNCKLEWRVIHLLWMVCTCCQSTDICMKIALEEKQKHFNIDGFLPNPTCSLFNSMFCSKPRSLRALQAQLLAVGPLGPRASRLCPSRPSGLDCIAC